MFERKNKAQADFEIFTIFDSKTASYVTPSFAINHLDMIRQMTNMFKDPEQRNNRFLVNAEDYSIFRIGTFSKQTGEISATKLEHIANLHDIRALVDSEQRVNTQIPPHQRAALTTAQNLE